MAQDLDNNNELQLFMQNLCQGIKNFPKKVPSQIIQSIIYIIKLEIDNNIESHGRWDGQGNSIFSHGVHHWKELAPSTIKSYQYKYGDDFDKEPTLFRSGRLRRSIAVTYKNDLTFEISANTPYAAVHQLGSDKIPARPYIVLSESAMQKIIDLVMQGIQQSIV